MSSAAVKPEKLGRGRTVLIVDDVALIRTGVARAFSSYGFVICGEAENGQDAIDQVIKFTPDLIILDVAMPVVNGLEAGQNFAGSLLKRRSFS